MADKWEWESPMAALERSLYGKSRTGTTRRVTTARTKAERDQLDVTVSAIPPEGTCEVCAHKILHKRGLCKTCWRIEVGRYNGG
jgi:hypothetical protein